MRIHTTRTVVTLSALLLASLACNLTLAIALLTSFQKLQLARIFPLGYVAEPLLRPGGAGRPTIAFWGDSRAHSWAGSADMQGRTVADFAHGGQTSSQLRLQLETTAPEHVEVAIVQIGINDLHPLGAMAETKDLAISRLRENIVAIRDLLLERSDIVVMTTIFPPGPVPLQRRYAWDSNTPQYIQDVNAVIRNSATGKRVVLLDAYTLLVDTHSTVARDYVDPDFFLHINPAAYARLNAALRQTLAAQNR